MTAKVDKAVSVIPSLSVSASSPHDKSRPQSDTPITTRPTLGDIRTNADQPRQEHSLISETSRPAASRESDEYNGRLPSTVLKGGKRIEKDAVSYNERITDTPGSASPTSSGKRYRPGMSHSNSSPQLANHQAERPFDDAFDRSIPPPCDARKHRHHSPPRIRIGAVASPTRSGSSSGGVLLSTVRDKVSRNRSSSSVSRQDAAKQLWQRQDPSVSDSDEEILAERTPSEDPRRGFSLSEVDNSARYYHRYPSKSASTSPSRTTNLLKPDTTETTFAPVGSLIARRRPSDSSNPLAHGTLNLPGRADQPVIDFLRSPSLSPKNFLKGGAEINASNRLVILTPTTQEWRELGLENLGALGGEGGNADSGSDRERKTSWESVDSDLVFDGFEWTGVPRRPRVKTTRSVEALEMVEDPADAHRQPEENALGISAAEKDHDSLTLLSIPRSSAIPTPLLNGRSSRTHSRRNSYPDEPQSAPPLLEEGDLFAKLIGIQVQGAQRAAARNLEESDTSFLDTEPTKDAFGPVETQSVSISRSQSMKETGEGPKRKEKERERLFRLVGEEVERDGIGKSSGGWGIKQFGTGGGLAALSPAALSRNVAADTSVSLPEPRDAEVSSEGKASRANISGLSPEGKTKPAPPKRLISTVSSIGNLSMTSAKPNIQPSPLHTVTRPPSNDITPPTGEASPQPNSRAHSRVHSRSPTYNATQTNPASNNGQVAPVSPITSRRRQSQRLSSLAGRSPQPFAFPAVLPPSHPTNRKSGSGLLSAFSPFNSTNGTSKKDEERPAISRAPSTQPFLSIPHYLQQSDRMDSTISIAPSTRAPSEPATPVGETAGGMGGHGIDDYVIITEAGKGAYGLVKRARQKGWHGEPIGDEVIIKYIIKSRILADCWKKHKVLGPIPIEIHVMDQLRNVPYKAPSKTYPWDPLRLDSPLPTPEIDYFSSASATVTPDSDTPDHGDITPTARTGVLPGTTPYDIPAPETHALTEGNLSTLTAGDVNPLEWHAKISAETVKNRGHPNVCKMLDFFEDREFYYLVMPRFGIGLDLFDRVEGAPDGLPAFEIRSLLGQLADALRFLHANGIVHRDIKDENVVLDGEGHCQLIDFGSAAHWRPGRKWDTFSGTLDYASPEILRGEMYSGKEQDVWALGVVGYVLICGETPFLSADEAQAGLGVDTKPYHALMRRCSGQRGQEGLEPDGGGKMKHAYDFVQRCLEMKPEDRPPAEALVKHKFVLGHGGWMGHRNWVIEGP